MSEPKEPPIDKLAIQRLSRQVDGFARGLGVDVDVTQEIVEKVVADMPDRNDGDRLMETRKRLLIVTA